MLAACSHAGDKPALPIRAPDPIVEIRTVVRTVCPADLDRPLPADPGPPQAGAVVRHNDEGGAWLDQVIARGLAAVRVVADSRAVCAEGSR